MKNNILSRIDNFKSLNITFNNICKEDAIIVLKEEIPEYKLMEYSQLFNKYRNSDCFINLDFYQLYLLARIDEKIGHVVCKMCLELELSLKTFLTEYLNDLGNLIKEDRLKGFFELEKEYLQEHYNKDVFELICQKYHSESIFQLNCEQFIDFVQFGTFERFLIYCLSFEDNQKMIKIITSTIPSVIRLRNCAAHNISLITSLKFNSTNNKNRVSAYLGSKGFKSRTLKSNMNKAFTVNFLNLLYLYITMVPNHKYKETFELLCLLIQICDDNLIYFEKNEFIISSYRFLKNAILTLCENLENNYT